MYLFRSSLPLILPLFATLVTSTYVLHEVFEWSQVDFAYPDEKLKERAKATGAFIPKNALPVGVEHWRNKLFVTFPRWEDGMCGFAFINIDYITLPLPTNNCNVSCNRAVIINEMWCLCFQTTLECELYSKC